MSDLIEVILPDSPRAASIMTVTGWVSAKGHFYGQGAQAESMARWDGSTHRKCEGCGELFSKSAYCRPCHAKKEIDKYNAMPRKKWDGVGMLYSDAQDRYLYGMDDVEDYCASAEVTPESLRLIICDPTYAGEIDPADHYCDGLPDEGEIPNDLQKAFDNLNAFIREEKIILSWSPGKFAAEIE